MDADPTARPSRLARRLLRRTYGPAAADEILDELEELASHRHGGTGRFRSRVFFWRQIARHVVLGRRGLLPDDLPGEGPGLRGWLHDVRHAARKVSRSPGHALVTVATLGIGIGAVAAVFSLVNMLLFAPLPFAEPERLVVMRDVLRSPGRPEIRYTPRARSVDTLRLLRPDFEVAGHRFGTYRVAGTREPTQVVGVQVTDRWFEVLGISPHLGRRFTPEEQAAGEGARVAMIGHELWRRAFAGDPAVVGQTALLNGQPHVVAGVMPPGVRFPWGAEVWVQGDLDPTEPVSFGTFARLPGGMDTAALGTALADATRQARSLYPEAYTDVRFDAEPMRDYLVDNRDGVAWLLLVSVAMLLLLACANIAGLATVRVLGQERELAVRAALGSGHARLFRLVFLEGALLAVAGGVLGLGIAAALQNQLGSLGGASQSGVGLLLGIDTDLRVVGFTAAITGLVALLASALPALRVLGTGRAASLAGVRGGGEERATGRLLSFTVVAQSTIGATLVIVSVAVAHAYIGLETSARGYETDDRRVVRFVLPEEDYPGGDGRWRRLDEIERRLRQSPEVVATGYTHHLPMTPGTWLRQFTFETQRDGSDVSGDFNVRWVSPGYTEALGLTLLAGRSLTHEELSSAADVAVISADVARRLAESPGQVVGTRIKIGRREDESPWLEVVGVLEQALEEWSNPATVYIPYSHSPQPWVEMVVHHRPGTGEQQLAALLRRIDPDQPVDDIRSLAALQSEELAAERLSTLILGVLATGGLAITLLGTYGLVSFRVRRRRRDLGIRMALGCASPRLTWLVVSRGVGLVVGGVLAAVAITPTLVLPLLGRGGTASLNADLQLLGDGLRLAPAGTTIVLGLVIATAALACLIPVLRALAADPLSALRED